MARSNASSIRDTRRIFVGVIEDITPSYQALFYYKFLVASFQ